MDFQPDSRMAAQLEANRAGKLARSQRMTVLMVALFSSVGLICLLLLLIAILGAALRGLTTGGIIGGLFLGLFLLTYLYLGGTLFVNARAYLPDALSSSPVKQVRGALKIKMPERDRPELPFSYIVDDYSFAPFVVPAELEMEKGQRYVVYYAGHSRMFLSIEPEQE